MGLSEIGQDYDFINKSVIAQERGRTPCKPLPSLAYGAIMTILGA
jgi:hypothetical protein